MEHLIIQASVWVQSARVIFVIATLGTIWLSLAPVAELPSVTSFPDIYAHFAGYTILGFLAMASGLPRSVAFVTLVVLGTSLEIIQGFSGYRFFELKDIAVNAVGTLAGILLAVFLGQRGVARP